MIVAGSFRLRHTVPGWLRYLLPLSVSGFLLGAALLNSIAYVRNFVDDTAYHIPLAVEIARHHNPYYVDTGAAFLSFWFPAGAETLVALLVAAGRSIHVTNLSGAIFFALFLWAAYGFAGIWVRDRFARLLCVTLVATIPILLAQTRAFDVDIHFNFLIYLSLYLYALTVTRGDANYAGIGLGMVTLTASVKYHGLIIAAVLVPVGLLCAWRAPRRRIRMGVVIIVAACIVFTSGWYGRNLLLKGNPIYPLALPQPLAHLSTTVGLPYEGIDFPNMSPRVRWPQPWIPATVAGYEFRPDMTGDAFGLIFPIALVMVGLAALRTGRMTPSQRRAFWLTIGVSVTVVIVLPFHLSVPRYVLFLPAVAALAPAFLVATAGDDLRVTRTLSVIVLALSLFYVGANLIDYGTKRTLADNAVLALREQRASGIINPEFVEQGNLRIGYVGGRFAFIATLYDRRLTNRLIQLHYQDYLLDHGPGFADAEAFVRYVRELNLDYICIFDGDAPGAQHLQVAFPEKTFVIDAANSSPDYHRYRLRLDEDVSP